MSIVLIHQRADLAEFKKSLQKKLPDTKIELLDEVEKPEEVEFAITWKHPHGIFNDFKKLKVIASFGAGVHHILSDEELPKDVIVTKIVNDQLTKDMCDFVLMQSLNYLRNTTFYYKKQQLSQWKPKPYKDPKEVQVGILGLGTLGSAVAKTLLTHNFKVCGWSSTKKEIEGIESFSKNELNAFLQKTNILVCLLPLTEATKGILNKDIFNQLPDQTCLINVARGEHLNEVDLKQAIENGKIEAAFLDVFDEEPLPEKHWFWKHKAIHLTPHVASVTKPSEVVTQLTENYLKFKADEQLKNKIDLKKAY